MKIILLSGGSGTRLWPLSNDSRAKQFLQVLKNEETGELESMLQRVYRQLLQVVKHEDIIIASNKVQIDMIRKQIGDIPVVLEPERRDTFPAIALATSYLYSELGVLSNEVVGVVSVDAFVDVAFYKKVMQLEALVHDGGAQLGLLGIKPTYNSSKYGYLIPKTWNGNMMVVESFKEKPSEEEAQKLIDFAAYWNSGVFAFPISLIIEKLEQLNMPLDFSVLQQQFMSLPKNSFDYEVVENLKNTIALTYDGYWKDLGTWNTLTEEMSQQVIGNGGMSNDCDNTHIINELDLPVKVLGISNAVVSVSADGILVSDKPSSSKMKDMLHEGLFSRPMYEERRWGWYRVVDFTKTASQEVLTKRLFIEAGKNLSYQFHQYRSEVWTVISGEAMFILNGELKKVLPGDVLKIPVGAKHALIAIEDTEIIEVQMGEFLVEDDIVRLTYDWQEIDNKVM
ncbi:sugar phosphate nucleotidyltransferase [Lysinibacillus fusiformis]|uniref:sugar phosphate nucleotidyltransferase n=1 Tax=Lysinibacillus fusiformis TaxID=28031 RepID=UPI001F4D3F10|nr:sugar phosphate nucleotidyltransferase [Lysinibacillus fusiformis]MCK1986505.1 sugar phosphate nucleotidyltransferase [Lysinibacillus fusiformis]